MAKRELGLLKSGFVGRVSGKAKITTINDCVIDYVSGKAKIGTMNDGYIRFLDDKAELATDDQGKNHVCAWKGHALSH